MDLNIVRLVFQLPPEAAERFASVLIKESAFLEKSLAPLCGRQLSTDPEIVRRHQKPALPFVFDLPLQTGNTSVINLLLAGPAISHIPLFCHAIAKHSDVSEIRQINAMNYQGEQIAVDVEAGDDLPVLSLLDLLDMKCPDFTGCSAIRLAIQTPVRIASKGRELTRFCPVVFVRALLRRISSLAAYYGNGADPEQFTCLATLASSLSARQVSGGEALSGRRGITGTFDLHGPLDQLGPYLALGSLFHLGKGAAFGMGSYNLRPVC